MIPFRLVKIEPSVIGGRVPPCHWGNWVTITSDYLKFSRDEEFMFSSLKFVPRLVSSRELLQCRFIRVTSPSLAFLRKMRPRRCRFLKPINALGGLTVTRNISMTNSSGIRLLQTLARGRRVVMIKSGGSCVFRPFLVAAQLARDRRNGLVLMTLFRPAAIRAR